MRKAFVLVFFIGLLGFLSLKTVTSKIQQDLAKPVAKPTVVVSPTEVFSQNAKETKSLFVPYWTVGDSDIDTRSYNELLYFGVTPTIAGIDTSDPGYKNLQKFINSSEGNAKRFLTLRMLDSKENFAIIENENARQKVIAETFNVADEYEFDGIVLDLEVSAIPFDSVIKNISIFVREFYAESKRQNKAFYITVYGDTYYRLRPFDMKVFAGNSDKILIMAYDFHKARGNPGPNFPLSGNESYGYDYDSLVNNFLEHVPHEKLAVIFGMFGYDWIVNDKGKAVDTAQAVSYLEAKQSFIDSCEYKKCEWKRDNVSGEIAVTYINESNKKHIVWLLT